jgi:hypothetical protein
MQIISSFLCFLQNTHFCLATVFTKGVLASRCSDVLCFINCNNINDTSVHRNWFYMTSAGVSCVVHVYIVVMLNTSLVINTFRCHKRLAYEKFACPLFHALQNTWTEMWKINVGNTLNIIFELWLFSIYFKLERTKRLLVNVRRSYSWNCHVFEFSLLFQISVFAHFVKVMRCIVASFSTSVNADRLNEDTSVTT